MALPSGLSRLASVATITAVIAVGTIVVAPSASADADVVSDAQSADTELQARSIALEYHHRVRVDSETSPTSLVYALPDGSFTAESDVVPQRVRKDNGWVDVDTTLTRQDGWWLPQASAAPVKFSAGGSDDLALVRAADGTWMTESWPYGQLPTPKIDGDSATYHDVFPDVDLQVKATEVGMSEVLILRSANAAKDPRLASVKFTIEGATPAVQAKTRSLTATTPKSSTIGSASPLWWDSSQPDSTSDSPGGAEPHGLAFNADSSSVSLDVKGVTSKPGLTYPVYVDPDWASYPSYLMADWYDDRAIPTAVNSNPPEDSVGYGIQGGVGYMSRAFFKFDTSVLKGKQIIESKMSAYQTYANSCDTTLVQAWRFAYSGGAFDWNDEPAAWAQLLDQQGNANGGPCAPSPATVGWVVTQGVAYTAANSLDSTTIGLRVANEANSLTRKHYRWDASLVTQYNTPPAQPSNLRLDYGGNGVRSCAGTSATNPIKVSLLSGTTAVIPMRATLYDPDTVQNNGSGVLYVNDMSGSTPVGVYSATLVAGAQGAIALNYGQPSAGFPQLTDGHLYKWYVVSTDGSAVGPHSIDCYFVPYTHRPNVTATVSVNSAPFGSQGSAVITVSGADLGRITQIEYSTQPSTPPVTAFVPNSIACAASVTTDNTGAVLGRICNVSTSPVTLKFPIVSAAMTVKVVAVDAVGDYAGTETAATIWSGSTSSNASVDLGYSAAGHAWLSDTGVADPAAGYLADGNPSGPNLVIPAGSGATLSAGEATPGSQSTASPNSFVFTMNGTAGTAPIATPAGSPVLASTSSPSPYSVGAWIKPAVTTGTQVILSQKANSYGAAFTLQLVNGTPQFCIHSQVSSLQACAIASGPVTAGAWTWVMGVWDAKAGELRIYLAGNATAVGATLFTDDQTDGIATTPIVLGASLSSAGAIGSVWNGKIADPFVVGGVPGSNQIANLKNNGDAQGGL